jgi:hypothetical protein
MTNLGFHKPKPKTVIMAYLLFLIPLLIAGVPAYIIALVTRKQLTKGGNENAKTISIITFVVSTIIFLAVIFAMFIYNFSLER